MMENPRLRILVGTNGRLLAIGLVVVAGVAFVGAGLTYANPPTEQVSQQTYQRSVSTEASTSVVVSSNRTLWPEGTVLEDQPVYLRNASERLNLTAVTAVEGTDSATITHGWHLRMVVTSGGEPFYVETRLLNRTTHEGTTARTTATVNVTAVTQRVATVQQQVAGAGVVSVDLVLSVGYETDPGREFGYENETNLTAPLELRGNAYSVGSGLAATAQHSERETTTVTRPRDWTRISALALVGVIALAGAVGILRERPAEIDVTAARHELHRRQYGQWISPGVIPIMGMNQEFVELDSLEDVVDVAIDTNERVVYDDRRDLYAVISENVVYYYSTSGSWMETAFPGMNVSREPPGGPDGAGGPDEPDGGPFDEAFDFPTGDGEGPADGGEGFDDFADPDGEE